jgi:hypothetical protein
MIDGEVSKQRGNNGQRFGDERKRIGGRQSPQSVVEVIEGRRSPPDETKFRLGGMRGDQRYTSFASRSHPIAFSPAAASPKLSSTPS